MRVIDADTERVDEFATLRLGVNLTDFRCLDILSREAPLSVGRRASESGLTTGAVTALVGRLERAGYVRRARDPKDRRRVLIPPTRRVARKVWPPFKGIVDVSTGVLSQFSKSELEIILRFLETNKTALREQLNKMTNWQRD